MIIEGIAAGFLANYLYAKLFKGREGKYGLFNLLPLPPPVIAKYDKAMNDAIITLVDEGRDRKVQNRFLRSLQADDDKRYRNWIFDAALFNEEKAKEHLKRAIRDELNKDESAGPLIDGTDFDAECERLVQRLKELITDKIPAISRFAAMIRSAEQTGLIVESFETEKNAQRASRVHDHSLATKYRAYLKERYREAMISGFDAFVKSDSYATDLEKSFVSLFLSDGSVGTTRSVSAETVLAEEKYIIMRGPAGCGKTTLLQWLCLGGAGDLEKLNLTPVMVPLRKFSTDSRMEISLGNLAKIASEGASFLDVKNREWLVELLDSGNALLLLDGVDELGPYKRDAFWNLVSDIKDDYPACRVIITSRNLFSTHASDGDYKDLVAMSDSQYAASQRDWRPPVGFLDFRIQGLRQADILPFVDKWHSGVDRSKIHPGVSEKIDAIASSLKIALLKPGAHSDLRHLCSTPMLCALLCMVNLVEKGRLPDNPKKLYSAALEILLQSRDEIRGVKTDPRLDALDKDTRREALEFIAFQMQEELGDGDKRYQSEASKRDVVAWTKHFLQERGRENEFLFDAEELVGFLVERVSVIREPTIGKIDFVHRSFMEFLAAEYFVKSKPYTAIDKLIEKETWQGTLRFMVNSDAGGVFFNGYILEEISEFFDRIGPDNIKTHTDRVLNIIEYMRDVHSDRLELYKNILDKIRPINMRSGFLLRNVPLVVLESVFFENKVRGKYPLMEEAFVFLYHTSRRSREILERGYGSFSDREYILELNLARKIGLAQQRGLVNVFCRYSDKLSAQEAFDKIYVDDLDVFSKYLKEASISKLNRSMIGYLVVDKNTQNMELIGDVFGYREIYIDSIDLDTVRTIASVLVRSDYNGTINVSPALALSDLSEFDRVRTLHIA